MTAPATTTEWTCFSVSIEDGVAHIQLNRPEAMNAMNRAFWNELPAIVRDIDDNARARLLTMAKHPVVFAYAEEQRARLGRERPVQPADHGRRNACLSRRVVMTAAGIADDNVVNPLT